LDNHDHSKPLARQSAGTLTLRNGGEGLDWDATPADTSYGRDAVANARAGNYGGCSFGFNVVKDKWSYNEADDVDERELLEIQVPEISVCTFPAYKDTSVSARSAMEARAAFANRTGEPLEHWAAEAYRAMEGWAESMLTGDVEYRAYLRAKYSADQIKEMGAKGQAFKNPDGHYSYPIGDTQDLENAIRAVGRGGADHDAIRHYIIGRAKALGAPKMIPDTWNADGSMGEANSAPTVTISTNDYTDGAATLIALYNQLPEDQRARVVAALTGETRTTAGVKDNDGDEPPADAKAADGQHQDHPPVRGSHTHAGGDSAHTHNAANGWDHDARSEPVTSTREDDERRDALRRAQFRAISAA
ncbi:MAG: HK97 family phage prohead protease, partial [Nitrososphaerales archaeon]